MIDRFIDGAETGAWWAGVALTLYLGFSFLGLVSRVLNRLTRPPERSDE